MQSNKPELWKFTSNVLNVMLLRLITLYIFSLYINNNFKNLNNKYLVILLIILIFLITDKINYFYKKTNNNFTRDKDTFFKLIITYIIYNFLLALLFAVNMNNSITYKILFVIIFSLTIFNVYLLLCQQSLHDSFKIIIIIFATLCSTIYTNSNIVVFISSIIAVIYLLESIYSYYKTEYINYHDNYLCTIYTTTQ